MTLVKHVLYSLSSIKIYLTPHFLLTACKDCEMVVLLEDTMNQAAVAKLLGISESFLSLILADKRKMSDETAYTIGVFIGKDWWEVKMMPRDELRDALEAKAGEV